MHLHLHFLFHFLFHITSPPSSPFPKTFHPAYHPTLIHLSNTHYPLISNLNPLSSILYPQSSILNPRSSKCHMPDNTLPYSSILPIKPASIYLGIFRNWGWRWSVYIYIYIVSLWSPPFSYFLFSGEKGREGKRREEERRCLFMLGSRVLRGSGEMGRGGDG